MVYLAMQIVNQWITTALETYVLYGWKERQFKQKRT